MNKEFQILLLSTLILLTSCASIEQNDYAYLVLNAKSVNTDARQPHWISFYELDHRRREYVSATEKLSKIWAGRYVFSNLGFEENRAGADYTSYSIKPYKTSLNLKSGNIYFIGELQLIPKSEAGTGYGGFDMELIRDESMLNDICSNLPDLSIEYPIHLVDIEEDGQWVVRSPEQSGTLACTPEANPT